MSSLHFRSPVLPYDDAFIAYRYVENFGLGNGLVYNAGERAWGYSTVGYVLWLCAWHRILPHVPLPELAVRTNVIPFMAAGLAVYLLLLRCTGKRLLAGFGSVLTLMNPGLLGISTGGMGPFPVPRIRVVYVIGRPRGPGRDRRHSGGTGAAHEDGRNRLASGSSVPVSSTAAFVDHSHNCRGSPSTGLVRIRVSVLRDCRAAFDPRQEPASVRARSAGCLFPDSSLSGHDIFVHGRRRSIGPLLSRPLFGRVSCLRTAPFEGSMDPAVPLLGRFPHVRGWQSAATEWYWPLLFVPALMAMAAGICALMAWIDDPPQWTRRLAGGAIAGSWAAWMIVANANGWSVQDRAPNQPNWPVTHIGSEPGRLRCNTYKRAAEWINARRRAGETVLAPEIGALGYYLHGPLIDACGLVSPEAIRYLPVPPSERLGGDIGSIPLALVRDLQPDFIVTLLVFARKNVLDDPWAKRTYTTAAEFELAIPVYGSDRILA